MANCGQKVIIILNLAVILAAVISAVVIYLNWDKLEWASADGANLPAVYLLVVAAFAVISAIIGLISACARNKCSKVLYLAVIIIVVIIEAVGVVIAFTFKDAVLDRIAEIWETDQDFREARRRFEEANQCCGFLPVENFSDYDCGWPDAKNGTEGCEKKIEDSLVANGISVAVAVIVLAVIELVLLIAAIYQIAKPHEDPDGITKF
jgi:hypothetical protein